MPGAHGFGGKDLLGLNIENKFFDWGSGVPRLVNIFGDAT